MRSNPLLPTLAVAPWDNPLGEVAHIRPPFFAIDTKDDAWENVPRCAVIICSERQGRAYIAYDEQIVEYINELAKIIDEMPAPQEG
jgi:hypothetical protein